MPTYPSGTVAFLFTDIEGSTRLWETDRAAMALAVERQLAILRDAAAAHGGILFKSVGDGTQSAFWSAPDALAAALAAQRALLAESWTPPIGHLPVRMALHAGEAQPRQGDYLAPPLNRLARLLAAGHGGQILVSGVVAELAQDGLPPAATLDDLGEHRLRDLYRPERVFQLCAPGLASEFPPLLTLERRPNNLPQQPTPFLGRDGDVARVVEVLQRDETRLVTLTGPGGVGKTRLSLQAAAEVLDAFADGVFAVELAHLADPQHVPAAIAQVLGVRAEGSRPLVEVLSAFFKPRTLLLVVDNFEHVLDAAPVVSTLLREAPGLKVLATSRAPLHLRGERELPVAPLAVPDPRRHESLERLSQYEAVRLFIARAQDARPDFAITNDTAPAVAEICARLDGLPLAIELAAARVRLLSPPALLARLERRLPLLTSGARDAPERQRTLRDTIAWSYDLLAPDEQTLFRRLTVFAGGIALEAAEEVATPAGDLDVLTGLSALVDESLLRERDGPGGAPRFTMLETVREFGLDALTASEEATRLRQRHAAWFLRLVELAEEALRGPEQITWLDRLEAERDNVRAAFATALERGDSETALRLANALGSFWLVRGTLREGREWLSKALGSGDSALTPAHARAVIELAWMENVLGDPAASNRAATRAAEEARALDLPLILGRALGQLAHNAAINDDLERATALVAESAEYFRALGPDAAPIGDRTLQARIAHRRGDWQRARTLFQDILIYCRDTAGDRHWIAEILVNLGDLDCNEGDAASAVSHYAEGLAEWIGLGDIWGVADALTGFAHAAQLLGQPTRAARLLGAADQFYEQVGIPVPPHDRINYPAVVAETRAALGEDAFATAYSDGGKLTRDEAIAEASALTEAAGDSVR